MWYLMPYAAYAHQSSLVYSDWNTETSESCVILRFDVPNAVWLMVLIVSFSRRSLSPLSQLREKWPGWHMQKYASTVRDQSSRQLQRYAHGEYTHMHTPLSVQSIWALVLIGFAYVPEKSHSYDLFRWRIVLRTSGMQFRLLKMLFPLAYDLPECPGAGCW